MLGLAWGRIWHITSREGNATRHRAPWSISLSSRLHSGLSGQPWSSGVETLSGSTPRLAEISHSISELIE